MPHGVASQYRWIQTGPTDWQLTVEDQILARVHFMGPSQQWALMDLGNIGNGYRTLEEVAEVVTKLRELNTSYEVAKYHEWIAVMDMVACKQCGFVRRADGRNDVWPCKGKVRITLRQEGE